MVYQWKDKVVLITGAAAGIGAITVRNLVEFEKVKHVTILDVSQVGFALEQEINSKFGKVVKFIKCDITKDDELDAAFKSVIDQFGYLDVLVNNAGLMSDDLHIYKKMIEVNVTGLFTSTLKGMELMRKDNGGRGGTIINIGSTANLFQHPITPMYFGTKSAVLQFSLCLALDEYYSRTRVRIITVCFGSTSTSLLSLQKLGTFDKGIESQLEEMLGKYKAQKPESAAAGIINAYKNGENGSTWLATDDKPVKNITEAVTKAYKILEETMY